jgi:hypothetical protein
VTVRRDLALLTETEKVINPGGQVTETIPGKSIKVLDNPAQCSIFHQFADLIC